MKSQPASAESVWVTPMPADRIKPVFYHLFAALVALNSPGPELYAGDGIREVCKVSA